MTLRASRFLQLPTAHAGRDVWLSSQWVVAAVADYAEKSIKLVAAEVDIHTSVSRINASWRVSLADHCNPSALVGQPLTLVRGEDTGPCLSHLIRIDLYTKQDNDISAINFEALSAFSP